MRVLLINSYLDPRTTAGRYRRFLVTMPPITLAYLAASLEKDGFDVRVYDDIIAGGNKALLTDTINRFKPDIVGLSCVTPSARGVYTTARLIKENYPDIKIVMGGIHASVFSRSILEKGLADAIVHNEGEITLSELLKAMEKGRGWDEVKGISFRANGGVVDNPPRPFIDNLDTIPFPAWRFFPIERYRIFNFASVLRPGALILGSRGCPYRCVFCSLKVMGNKRRVRSVNNIVDEIEHLHGDLGYRQISFTDPIFPFSREEGFSFSREMISRGLDKKVVWVTETRVDHVDQELLEAMREAGLRRIMYGFESATDEGLKGINKPYHIDKAYSAVEATRKAGVEIIGFFMLGVPDDNINSINATISMALRLGIEFAKFTVFVPFPGTKSYHQLKERGEIEETEEWERYTNYPTRHLKPVYLPPRLDLSEIVSLQRKAFFKFYLRPGMLWYHFIKRRSLGPRDIIGGITTLGGW